LDGQKHREEYLALLQREIENDQLNLQSNRLFDKTGQTNLGKPVDIRTDTEKKQGTEMNKVALREALKKITSKETAGQIVEQLSDSQTRFALDKFPIIEKKMKETYALGVPANVFVAYLNNLIDEYEDAIEVESGLQITTDLLTNTQLSIDLPQFDTLQRLDQVLDRANAITDTATVRQTLRDFSSMLMTPEDFVFYNQLAPEIRAKLDVDRNTLYREFPDNQMILVSLANLEEAIQQQDKPYLDRTLAELEDMIFVDLETVDEFRRMKDRMRQVPDDSATMERLDTTTTDLRTARRQKEFERSLKREAMLKQVEERRAKTQALERASMGEEDEVEKNMRLKEQVRKEILASRKPKPKPKDMPSMKAEKQAMGAEDRQPLPMRQAEAPELTIEEFKRLKKEDKTYILKDLVNKNPDLILVLKDRTGAEKQRGLNSPQKATSFDPFSVEELNSAYRQYKEGIPFRQSGKGLIRMNMSSKGKVMGHGIGHLVEKKTEKPKLYAPFGRYYIHKIKLDDNVLSFKSPSGFIPAGLATEKVSKELANVIHSFVKGSPNYDEVSELNEVDKKKLASICKKCQVMSPVIPKMKSSTQQEDDRFAVLHGQLIAGQDNLQLCKEFKALLLKMVNEGRIPKRQAHEVMHEMLMLGL
jgi:hypothetical protein